LDANTAAPASTEGAAGVELIGVAEKAAAAEPEALGPRAEGEARHGLETPPLSPPREGSGEPGLPPREVPTKGMHKRGLEAPPPPPRESPSEGKRGPKRAPQETPRAGVLAEQEGAPFVLRDPAPGFPREGPLGVLNGSLEEASFSI
jgi:hypothetical protein